MKLPVFTKILDGPGFHVMIEADGRTVYAYLVHPDGFDGWGDVCLFNLLPSTDEEEWLNDSIEPPYSNPKYACWDLPKPETVRAKDFKVIAGVEVARMQSVIYFRDTKVGVVWAGARPGKSRFAKVDSPVALAMNVEGDPDRLFNWLVEHEPKRAKRKARSK